MMKRHCEVCDTTEPETTGWWLTVEMTTPDDWRESTIPMQGGIFRINGDYCSAECLTVRLDKMKS